MNRLGRAAPAHGLPHTCACARARTQVDDKLQRQLDAVAMGMGIGTSYGQLAGATSSTKDPELWAQLDAEFWPATGLAKASGAVVVVGAGGLALGAWCAGPAWRGQPRWASLPCGGEGFPRAARPCGEW